MLDPVWAKDLGDYPAGLTWLRDRASLAVANGGGEIVLVEAADGTITSLGAHAHGAIAVAARADGAVFVSAGQDGTIGWWDAREMREIRRGEGGAGWIEHVAFQPGGRLLASAAGKRLRLWSADGELLHEYPAQPSAIAAIAWAPNGARIATGGFGGVWLHDVEGKSRETTALPWKGAVLTLAWSPNGKVIAGGMQEGAVHFWRLSGGHSQMQGYPGKVRETRWSANSRHLATGAGASIVIWDFSGKGPEGTKPIQLEGHTDRVTVLAYQATGGHLASGGMDWRLSLWRPAQRALAVDAHLLGAPPCALAWSPDGARLAVASEDGELGLYALAR